MVASLAQARWRRVSAAVGSVLVLVSSAIVQQVRVEAAAASVAAPAPEAMTAEQVGEMFRVYGDAGGQWTGGDSTVSARLPDGRVVWLFSDTFLGSVNPDGSRPAETPMVNNTIVVQDGAELVETLHQGTVEWPAALVQPEQPGEFFWVADAVVESGALKVLYNRYAKFGDGPLDVELRGTSLATFALPDLTVSSVSDLPVGTAVTWGSALLADGAHTYVYGSSAAPGGLRFGHVARAAAGDLGGAWQFWTGSAWSPDEGAAGRLLSGVGTAYAVQKVGTQYVLVTQETNLVFDPQFVAYTASSPTGPFTGQTYLLTAPEQQPGNDRIVYAARLHPDLAHPGKLLMSYDVNSLKPEDVFADSRLYRPRFVEIDWPRPAPGPVPAAPGGFTVTSDDQGVAHLSWSAVSGATGYRVWRRDTTAGQANFVRQARPATGTTADVSGLITGHRYEFKVSAANDAGDGAFTPTIAVTSRIVRDASVINLSGTPEAVPGSYVVRFKDSPHVRGAGVEAFARELVTQAGGTLGPVLDRTLNGFGATLTQAQAIDLAGHPDVLDVEQNQTLIMDGEIDDVATRGEQINPPSWGLRRISQRQLPLNNVYKFPNSGAGVRAYVIDSGIRLDHSMFGGRARYGRNTVDGTMDSPDCGRGHGTHVAGTLGGDNYGVARSVELVGVKVFRCRTSDQKYETTFMSITEGVEWVVRDNAGKPGRAVINMSLSSPTSGIRATMIDNAVRNAVARGIPVVAAAGNITLNSPGSNCSAISPAHLDEAITVANAELATVNGTQIDRRNTGDSLGFGGSKIGSCVDLYAPGTRIPSAGIAAPDAIVTKSGTSMASPHVAGVAAMVLNAHPTFTPRQVEQAIVGAAPEVVTDEGASTTKRLLYLEPEPPAQAPADLVATAKADGTIDLSWSPVAAQGAHYVVSQRDLTAGDTVMTRWRSPVFGATTAVARNLESGHTYEFVVAAANMAGVGPTSVPAQATVRTPTPPAPANLTASANANGTITLRWGEPEPDVWYWVYQRNLSAEEPDFTRLSLPVTACCTMTAGLLKHDDEYEYQVSAVNTRGVEGPRSNIAGATAKHPAPAPPRQLSVTPGNGEVTLDWTASLSPNVWYWVYQRNLADQTPEWTRLSLPITKCCTMTAGLLANNDPYEFYVTAVGAGPESTPSNRVVVTPRKPVPDKPTMLPPTSNADGTVTLRWIAPPDWGPYYFEVFHRKLGALTWSKIELPLDCCTFTAGLLDHNQAYEFKVRATNGRHGPDSDVVQAIARHTLPPKPTDLRGKTHGDGYVGLSWTPPRAGGFYYWVYYRNVSDNESTFTKAGLPTEKTFMSIGPLKNDKVYEFKVTAENPAGEGPASDPVRVQSKGGLPAAPANLSAVPGDGKVTLTWGASPTPNVWYWIEWREAGGPWQEHKLDTTCCNYVISSLTNGKTYEFKVRATNASGDGAAVGPVSARPMPPVPRPPTITATEAGDGHVKLTWTASTTPNVYYWIEYRPHGGGWRRTSLPVTTCCTHSVSYLTNGTTYDFRMFSTNLSGDSTPSNVVSARPMPALPAAPTNLRAYPGSSHVTLQWDPSPTPYVYYWIEYKRASGPWQRLQYPFSGCCAFEIRPLDNFVQYTFRVKATNLAGDSGPTNPASATPSPPRGSCWLSAVPPRPDFTVPHIPFNSRAYYSCTAVLAGAVLTTRYYAGPTWGYWDIWEAVRRIGTLDVGDVRSGSVDINITFFTDRCLKHYTWAQLTWIDINGKTQRLVDTSKTVMYTGRGVSCKVPEF